MAIMTAAAASSMSLIGTTVQIGERTIAIGGTAETGMTAGAAISGATDSTAGGSAPRFGAYFPLYWAFRFSTNAFMPSFWSSVAKSM